MKFKKIIRILFFITLFINLTIPKAGIYLHIPEYMRIPATLGYIIFLILFLMWVISNRKNLKSIFLGSFIKRVGLFYLVYAFLRYFFIDFSNYKIGMVIEHYIIYGGYLLAFYLALDIRRYGEKIIPAFVKIIIISMSIIGLYGLLQVFFDSEQIAVGGLTEMYGSPQEPVIFRGDKKIYNIPEGSASIKNSIFIKDNSGKRIFAGRKVFSTFHHGNVFGGHLVLFAPIIFSLLCVNIGRKQKIIYFCLGVIILLSLLFANSRGAIIGFFVSWLVLFLISTEKKKAFLLLTSVLLSAIILFNFILNIAQRYNLKITFADAQLYQKVIVQGRYGNAFKVPRLIKKRLTSVKNTVDVERDSVEFRLNKITNYRYRELKEFCNGFFTKKNIKHLIFGRGYTGIDVYQNLYFNLLYNLGIVGFSVFLYIIIYILRISKMGMILDPGHNTEARVLTMGGISGIVGFLIHNLFDNLFHPPPFGLNFWILCGLVLVASNYKEGS